MLHMARLSFHKPQRFDRKRADEKLIDHPIAEIREELITPLTDQEILVFAADEVRIDQEAVVRRAWYEKNKKTVVKVDCQKTAQSFIGFLDQNTGQCLTLRLDWQNSATILEAVQTLVALHPGKRIVIVCDDAKNAISNVQREDFESTVTAFEGHIRSRLFENKI